MGAELPGNVRQLQNLVEQCSILAPSDIIPLELTAQALRDKVSSIPTLDEARTAFERRYLIGVLRAAEGNITNAARMAGRNRTEFYKLLGRHSLDPMRFRRRARAEQSVHTDDHPRSLRAEPS
jgi:two-component system response regulator GlrR